MSNIIESHFGTLMSPKKIAAGAASSVRKQGAFYVFSLRVDSERTLSGDWSASKLAGLMTF